MIDAKVNVLFKIVGQLVDQYKIYLDLADRQRMAIVNNEIEDLNATNIELDQFGQSIVEIEDRRHFILGEISELLGVEVTNIHELAHHYHGDIIESLTSKVAELKLLLKEVRLKNLTNHKLVQNSREFIRSSIGIISGYTKQSKANQFQTYGNNGSMGNKVQQTRLLINRSI